MKVVGKVIIAIFLSILTISLLFAGVNMLKYSNWEEEFENNLVEENLSNGVEDLSEDIQLKISGFVNSEEKTDFMEFTVSELSQILDFALNSNVEGITIEEVYIEPMEGNWKIYLKSRVENFNIPWISMDIVKDDIESAEFYINHIYIGNVNFPLFLEKKILELSNSGVREAILLFNENLFSKRYLQNISLFEDRMVVKGVLY